MAMAAARVFLLLVFFIAACFSGAASAEHLADEKLSCTVCKGIVWGLQKALELNATEDKLRQLAGKICVVLKIEDKTVCDGAVSEFTSIVVAVFADEVLDPEEVCGVLKYCPPKNHTTGWNLSFPKPKPPHTPPVPPNPSNPKFSIVHLTDIHYDHLYELGTSTTCGEPICCRKTNGPGNSTQWGDHHCDLSLAMLNSYMKQLSLLDPPPRYVFWTGDNPPHDVWAQSKQYQLDRCKFLNELIHQTLPNSVVLPSIGNHESFPVNNNPPPPRNKWLYNGLSEQWSYWLPPESLGDVNHGGFYTLMVERGLRIISLNTNFCNNQNYWVYLNETDPGGMVQWMINILQYSEDHQEKVYVIGHIPPGCGDCISFWSKRYAQVVDRYEDTIAAQFFGHTHNDEFEVFYDVATQTRPLSIAYVSPSGTPLGGVDPSFKVFEVDEPSKFVVDLRAVTVDLDQTIATNKSDWFVRYQAKETLGMSGLFPEDWHDLVQRFNADDALFQKWYTFYNADSSTPPCQGDCKKDMLCSLTNAVYENKKKCSQGSHAPRKSLC